jgi:hypothetical protein
MCRSEDITRLEEVILVVDLTLIGERGASSFEMDHGILEIPPEEVVRGLGL